MLRNRWYVFAFAIVSGIVSAVLENYLLLLLFVGWVISLGILRRVHPFLVVLACGLSLATTFYIPTYSAEKALENEISHGQTTVSGKITSPIVEKESTFTFDFQTTDKKTLLVTYFKTHEAEQLPRPLQHGANCQLHGEITAASTATNPHQFDYQRYLWQQGMENQFILQETSDLACTNHSFQSYIYTIRNHLLHKTETHLNKDTVQWLHALVLGDDTLLDDKVVDVFRRWGLSHILAISGLHIGIISGIIYMLLVRYQILTIEKAKIFLCLFLPCYALLAGGQPSVWRAVFMVVIVTFLSFFRKRMNYIDLICMTFFILIIFDKYIIYHIGFQFSFAVTFGIIVSRKWLATSKTNVESIIKISFVSQMVMLPLQLHYFSVFDPLSIILNILVVPYFSLFVIPIMFLLLVISYLPAIFTSIIEIPFQSIHHLAIEGIMWVDAHLHFPFIIGKLPLYFIIVYYMFFIIFMIALEQKSKKAFAYGCALSLYVVFLAIRPYLSPYGTITMLDIGQGDAFIIEMPYRKGVYFIDIGAVVSFPETETSDREYKQIIKPYLYGQGINHIDAVFLSHEDQVHDENLLHD